jgi:hypothetical protein
LKILGYGEDALTLWALKQHVSKILGEFQDNTPVSECIAFYRPSFGRHGKKGSAIFGEFDAIIASKQKIYLIESKWDNHNDFSNEEFPLENHQILRHQIFAWYLTHWKKKYLGDWQAFITENQAQFYFLNKSVAPSGSLLAKNIEYVLTKIQAHCGYSSEKNIKKVFLFFYNPEKSKPPSKIAQNFKLIPIEYNVETKDNFVTLVP